MPESILIAGYYGFGNLGDEAILAAILQDLRRLVPQAQFTVTSAHPSETVRVHHVRSVPTSSLPDLVAEMRECDLVLLGGGGLFHDYWPSEGRGVLHSGLQGQDFYASIPLLARLLGKRCMIYAVGIGPLSSEPARSLTRQAFVLSQRSTLRDAASLDHLTALGGDVPPGRIEITADAAFSLMPTADGGRAVLRERFGILHASPLVGICLRNWDLPGLPEEWEAEVAEGLRGALIQSGARGLLVPCQQRSDWSHTDDRSIALRLRRRLGEGLAETLPAGTLEPDAALALFAALDCVLTMRLHPVIFAANAGVPTIGLACDPKLEHVMQELGQGNACLLPTAWHREAIQRAVVDALGRSPSDALRRAAEGMRARSMRSAEIAVEVLSGPPPILGEAEAVIASATLETSLAHASLEQALGRMDAQLESVASERNQFDEQITNLSETFGFRLLDAYWAWTRRIFPPGSRAKRAYRFATGLLRRWLRRVNRSPEILGSTLPLDGDGSGAAGVDPRLALPGLRPSSDARLELMRFALRAEVEGRKNVFIIVSPVQLIESEGQRATNLAFELADRGHAVVFVYWRWDTSPWATQEQAARGILQVPMDVFVRRPRELLAGFPSMARTILYEFPHPSLFGVNGAANAEGWVTVYDVIDDWQAFHRAGQAPWYDRAIEEHLACTADVVLAVNHRLASKMQELGRDGVGLLPNAARAGAGRVLSPLTLERGEVTLGYFGHLSPAWFDWSLIDSVAAARPFWRIYLIGYGEPDSRSRLRENIVLLGKKPQESLAAYAANWDVGIVPFRSGDLAAGADVIKLYEYLGMDLPVVVTGVCPPPGAEDLVGRAVDAADFIEKVEAASAERTHQVDTRRRFVECNTWGDRASRLLEMLEARSQRAILKHALFGVS